MDKLDYTRKYEIIRSEILERTKKDRKERSVKIRAEIHRGWIPQGTGPER
jgi:hypothetical protein